MNEAVEKTSGRALNKLLALFVWLSLIFLFLMGLVTQIHGVEMVNRVFGWSAWWYRENSFTIFTISYDTYFIYAPVFFFLLSFYLLLQCRKDLDGKLSVYASLSSFLTACIWAVFIFNNLTARSWDVYLNSMILWVGAIFFFGITFLLIGLIFLHRDSRTLTRLTGLSFLAVGLIGSFVGSCGGAFIPWFTIFYYPWITTAAILPCSFAIIHEVKAV